MEDYSKYLNALNMASQDKRDKEQERAIQVTEAADLGSTVRGITDPLALGIGGAALKPVVTKGLQRFGVRNAEDVADAVTKGDLKGAARSAAANLLKSPTGAAEARVLPSQQVLEPPGVPSRLSPSLQTTPPPKPPPSRQANLRDQPVQPENMGREGTALRSGGSDPVEAPSKPGTSGAPSSENAPAAPKDAPAQLPAEEAALPEEELAVDEIPVVGPLVGVGLALASLFTGLFAPPHAPAAKPTINPATQYGV